MTIRDPASVVQELVDALNDHDLDAAYGLYVPEASHLGQPRPADGLEAMRVVDAEFFDAFPDHHRHIEQLITQDEAVAVHLLLSGTHTGPLPGVRPTGRRVSFAVCNILEIRDGRILSMRQFYDAAQIARQLAPPASA